MLVVVDAIHAKMPMMIRMTLGMILQLQQPKLNGYRTQIWIRAGMARPAIDKQKPPNNDMYMPIFGIAMAKTTVKNIREKNWFKKQANV